MKPPTQKGGFGAAPPADQPAPPRNVAADPAAAQQQANAQAKGQRQASPEEQELYNTFVSLSLMHLYDEQAMPNIVRKLEAGAQENPKQAIGEVGAHVAMAVIKKAADQGTQVPGHVVAAGGREVIGAIGELAERAAGYPKLDQSDIDGAYYVAADRLRMLMDDAGMIDDEAAAKDMQDFERMEREGGLEETARAMTSGEPSPRQPQERNGERASARAGERASARSPAEPQSGNGRR